MSENLNELKSQNNYQTMFPFFSYFLTFSLLFSLPCFPARKLPDQISKLTAGDVNNTWRGFAKFLDAGKGSHVSGLSDLKRYFQRFGYLHPIPDSNLTDTFDESFQDAVVSYQKHLGLGISGKLDSGTMSQIISPRCGVSDKSPIHTTRHYAYFYGQPRWTQQTPMMLTYAFSPDHMIDYLSLSDIKSAFGKAFARWSDVIPVNFTEAEDYYSADVKIGFYGGDHGDGEPFDGVLGILAHAFSPENGRLHLDSAETWAVDFSTEKSKVSVDLESVATHEIGHVLGLAHTSVKEAIMYPSLSPRTKKVDLKMDDVEGVQALYGSNPNFKFNSLLESDTSSSWAVGLRARSSVWATCAVFIVVLIRTFCC